MMKYAAVIVAMFLCVQAVHAQDVLIPLVDTDFIVPAEGGPNVGGAGNVDEEASEDVTITLKINDIFDPSQYKSLLLTDQEYNAIVDARNTIGISQNVTDAEVAQSKRDEENDVPKPPEEERYIRLGGILYKTSNEWVVWLNGSRVTPDAIPKEIIDFRVRKGYVEMKWYDDYTRQIFPIRLRANQQFHLDARMFLPG